MYSDYYNNNDDNKNNRKNDDKINKFNYRKKIIYIFVIVAIIIVVYGVYSKFTGKTIWNGLQTSSETLDGTEKNNDVSKENINETNIDTPDGTPKTEKENQKDNSEPTPSNFENNAAAVLINKYGQDGLIAVNTNGKLYNGTGNIREYRYSGGDGLVNNYIIFNDETWRIVGVFDTKDDIFNNGNDNYDIKIIKDLPIDNAPESYVANNTIEYKLKEKNEKVRCVTGENIEYRYSQDYIYFRSTGATISNDWTKSTLMYYLNEENSIYKNSYFDNLNDSYKKYIDTVTYYLGIQDSKNPWDSYANERDENNIWVYTSKVKGTPTWTGKIGLLYASDWGYATYSSEWTEYKSISLAVSQNKNWLVKPNLTCYTRKSGSWLITPSHSCRDCGLFWDYYQDTAFLGLATIYQKQYFSLDDYKIVSQAWPVQPTLYLKSDTKFVGNGDGTKDNPYKIIDN